jgi:hypothetical protein
MVVFEMVPKLLSPRLSASEAAMTCTELSRLRAVCHRVFLQPNSSCRRLPT